VKRRQREQELVVEREAAGEPTQRSKCEELRRVFIGFAIATLALLVLPFLAGSANAIAELSGVSITFIGTSLVGIATSRPKLVAAAAAGRLASFDLAVGNLFGSNVFNMTAFFIVDIAYRSGRLFNDVSDTHATTALRSVFLMSIGLMGIICSVEKQFILFEPSSASMIVGYAICLWLLFA